MYTYTATQLEHKTFGELKSIARELDIVPSGDRRCRQSWIDAIAGVNPPLLQLLEVSTAPSADRAFEPIAQAVENSFGVEVDLTQEPIVETVEAFLAVSVEQVHEDSEWVDTELPNREDYEFREEYDEALKKWAAIVASTSSAVETSPGVEPDCFQEPIALAAKNSPGVDRAQEPIRKNISGDGCPQEPIAQDEPPDTGIFAKLPKPKPCFPPAIVVLEFRLSSSKSALAVRLAKVYQERERSLATSYQVQPEDRCQRPLTFSETCNKRKKLSAIVSTDSVRVEN